MIMSRICSSSKDFTNICFLSDLLLMIQISNQGKKNSEESLKFWHFLSKKFNRLFFFETGRKLFEQVFFTSSRRFLRFCNFSRFRGSRGRNRFLPNFFGHLRKNLGNIDFFLDYVRDTIKSKTFIIQQCCFAL